MLILLKPLTGLLFVTLLTGCSSLLPRVENTTESPWHSFEDAQEDFEKIIPGQTTISELKELGFDPYISPNVSLINYLDLIQHFIPNSSIEMEDLPPSVQACLYEKEACYGYVIEPSVIHSKRYGNAALDVLNFKKLTQVSGWRFKALLVLKKDLVVYKLAGGEPNVLKFEKKNNPLGPLQDIGDVLRFK
jgi:hypothetical protein